MRTSPVVIGSRIAPPAVGSLRIGSASTAGLVLLANAAGRTSVQGTPYRGSAGVWMSCGKLCGYERMGGWSRRVLALRRLAGGRMREWGVIATGPRSSHIRPCGAIGPPGGGGRYRHTLDEPPRWTTGDG